MKNKFRNLIISSAMLTVSAASFAQTEKGKSIVGINASIYSYNVKAKGASNETIARNSSQFIELNYGKFVRKNLLVGLGASFSASQLKSGFPSADISSNATGIVFSPGIRQYFGNNGNFTFFGGAYYSLGFVKTKSEGVNASPDQKSITSSLTAELGMNYFINQNFALEAKIYNNSGLINLTNNSSGLAFGIKYWPQNTTFTPLEESENTFKNWIIGVDVNTRKEKTQNAFDIETTSSTTQAEIYAGKFIGSKKNHLVGLGLGRETNKNSSGGNSNTHHRTIITPFYEYYFKTTKLTPIAKISSSFSIFSSSQYLLYMENSADLGLAYFVSDHFLVKANFIHLGANFQRQENGPPTYVANQFHFNIFDNSTLGLAYRW